MHVPESVLEPFMLSVLLTVASIDENQVINQYINFPTF